MVRRYEIKTEINGDSSVWISIEGPRGTVPNSTELLYNPTEADLVALKNKLDLWCAQLNEPRDKVIKLVEKVFGK